MDIALAIFAYNRPFHLGKVLEALKKNMRLQNVYIFQDGLADENAREDWIKVREMIYAINWMEYSYITYPQNIGCAASIETGIAYVLNRHDAIIVLEDDCLPHPNFIQFAVDCLEKYKNEKKVWGVSGYAWPMELSPVETSDVYACGRTCSYGWATWKDRWQYCARDFDILKGIYADQEASQRLGIWGTDLEDMLCATLRCQCDAWDVFWSLCMIERGGYFINPYKSLIQNIGFDGSGLHCGMDQKWNVDLSEDMKGRLRLPDSLDISIREELAFADLHNGYGHQAAYKDLQASKAIVWGIGTCYRKNKKQLLKKYDVQAFIDKRKIKYFEGKPVIDCESLERYNFEYILIMINNVTEAERMKKKLIQDHGIADSKIKIGTL